MVMVAALGQEVMGRIMECLWTVVVSLMSSLESMSLRERKKDRSRKVRNAGRATANEIEKRKLLGEYVCIIATNRMKGDVITGQNLRQGSSSISRRNIGTG